MNICTVSATTVATIGWSGAGRSRVRVPAEVRAFSVLQKSSPTLGPTQPPIQGILVLFSAGKAGAGSHEFNHSSCKESQLGAQYYATSWLYLQDYTRMHGQQNIKLTTHLHLASSLRVNGTLRLFPIYTFTAWRGKMLLLMWF